MSKSGRAQTDIDKRNVIRELLTNSNENITKIAEKYGFSRQKVWRITKRLEKNKTIWGYSAVIDNEKLDLQDYFIMLKRTPQPLPIEKLKTIINGELKQEFEGLGVDINSCYYVHGCYDFILCATSKDIGLMKKLCEALKTLFRDYISNIQLLEVIFTLRKCGFDNPNPEGLIEYFSTES